MTHKITFRIKHVLTGLVLLVVLASALISFQRALAHKPGTLYAQTLAADWVVYGTYPVGFYGISVSSAGDVNGDGFTDILVGASNSSNGQLNEGQAFLYYGSPTGSDTTADWMGEGNAVLANFGGSVSEAGDVNGDGFDDVLIGVSGYKNASGLAVGAVFLYYGSPSGLGASPDWIMEGEGGGGNLGSFVSTAGDVNGDGFTDVIFGVPFYSHGEDSEGKVYVFYGSANGLNQNPDWSYESNLPGEHFGADVSTAGDVNGDGFDEIIFGSWHQVGVLKSDGKAYVFYGSRTGLNTTPNWIGDSVQNGDAYSHGVKGVGDINLDGYGDVIVGASAYANGQVGEGAVFLYFGSANGLSITPEWIGESNNSGAGMGRVINLAGDWNNDGYKDVLITSPGAAKISVYTGAPTGLNATPFWSAIISQTSVGYGTTADVIFNLTGNGIPMAITGAFMYDGHGAIFGYTCSTCQPFPPSSTPRATRTPTITPTPTETIVRPTWTPSPTATPQPTRTPSPTATP